VDAPLTGEDLYITDFYRVEGVPGVEPNELEGRFADYEKVREMVAAGGYRMCSA
jgi:hypothetical protein